jgi:hypothetical protein
MNPLSKEAEEKLVKAMDQVTDLVQSGQSPNEAIIKVATQEHIPLGHIHLMVTSYNTGRSEAQRKACEDPLEKSAEFEMAELSPVLERLYPDSLPLPGQIKQALSTSSDYLKPPTKPTRFTRGGKYITAPANVPKGEKVELKTAIRKEGQLQRAERAYEEARLAAQNSFDAVNLSVSKIASYMRLNTAPPFDEVKENSEILFGEKAAKLMDYIAKRNLVLTKKASISGGGRVDVEVEPYRTIRFCLQQVGEHIRLKAAYDEAEQAYDKEKKAYFQSVSRPQPEPGSVDELFFRKEAFLGSMIGGALTGAASQKAREMAAKKPDPAAQAALKLKDPQQEAEVRNAQTQAMLSDFLANDEVISGHDPNEVLAHFNELSQLAPRATSQQGLMRSLLRTRLQTGSMAPFEIETLLKIENALKERDKPSAPAVSVLAPPPVAGVL